MPRPSLPSTPEQQLGRNDSKNPATTCKGITSSGRPCRRALAVSKLISGDDEYDHNGIVAIVREKDRLADAQYFCWQHKDQVYQSVSVVQELRGSNAAKPRREVHTLQNRSSINSLMHNLNITAEKPVCSRRMRSSKYDRSQDKPSASARPGFWQSLCCMSAHETEDRIEIVRHRHRVEQGRIASHPSASLPKQKLVPRKEHNVLIRPYPSMPMTYIKGGTSPQIQALLLTEMVRPISPHDEEGYIYMFWLTPTSRQAPLESTAQGLLSDEHDGRRLSDVMSDFSVPDETADSGKPSPRKVMLKIGRANNVTRRMNEWQRQCGYELSLVRWYPYISQQSNSATSKHQQPGTSMYPDLSQHSRPQAQHRESEAVRKVANVKRVERLIHIELSAQQVKKQCATCGREHREWFLVDANETGVKRIDATIRRWVRWSDDQQID